jgi:hypothetical protein
LNGTDNADPPPVGLVTVTSIWYPVPVRLMDWLANIAIPLLPVVALVLPLKVAPLGFTARVITQTAFFTRLPFESVTFTFTEGVI